MNKDERFLVVITLEKFFKDEHLWINSLFEAGLQYLHLRKLGAKRIETEDLIRGINAQYYNRIVLHDNFEIAVEYNLGGVHLNKRNPFAPTNFTGRISRSCHSIEEVARYKYECFYVTLSPVFNSISKVGYNSAFSPEQLAVAAFQGIIDNRVVALGGITVENIRTLKKSGFGGAAVLGTIWNAKDCIEAVDVFKALTNKFINNTI